jgi:hypothetical protein
VLALTSEKVRASLLGIPPQLLVGLNAMRILGVLFLLDFMAGSLSGPFPFFAGLGDMITGALAIPLALSIARSKEPSVRTIAGWNAFGTLDLVVAVGLGITSASGSPLQLIHAGVGSQAMQYLPLSLVPTVLVPFYLLTHAIVAAQLASAFQSCSYDAHCEFSAVGSLVSPLPLLRRRHTAERARSIGQRREGIAREIGCRQIAISLGRRVGMASSFRPHRIRSDWRSRARLSVLIRRTNG